MDSTIGRPDAVPAPGETIEVRPGILWVRLSLPFRLDHVNIYLIDDGDGWTVFDTGVGNDNTIAAWESLLSGPLSGRAVTRVICTHHHPDHVGMAGWLIRRFDAPLHMSEAEFLLSMYYSRHHGSSDGPAFADLYLSNGMEPEAVVRVLDEGHAYQRLLTGLPETFERLEDGESLVVGGRTFEVLTGGGHSSEQAMLLCREEGFFLTADQVLPRISPNIGVIAHEPHGNPLGRYLKSLQDIRSRVPDGTICYPGHDWPFDTLHQRIAHLIAHHKQRCGLLVEACSGGPKNAAELVPVLFPSLSDQHQISFGFMETLSHIHYLLGTGELLLLSDSSAVRRFRRA